MGKEKKEETEADTARNEKRHTILVKYLYGLAKYIYGTTIGVLFSDDSAVKKRRHGGIISAFSGSSEVVSQDVTSWWNFCHLSLAAGLLNIKLCRSRSSSWRRMGNPSPK